MQALYQLDVQGEDFMVHLTGFLREYSDSDQMVFSMAEKWTQGTWKHLEQCDHAIQSAAIKWELTRLSCVDRSILRLGVYQLLYCPDIPGKVVINEAIEIAKKFSGEQSPRFVNGVLDAVLKTHKGTES
jgi:N utilization substance protein B